MLGAVAIILFLWLILDDLATPSVKPHRVRLPRK